MFSAFIRDQRGAIAVLAAAFVGITTMATSAAIDVARIGAAERALKSAADQGALAGARAGASQAQGNAESMFDLSVSDDRGILRNIERRYALNGEEHTVTAEAEVKTLVLGLAGLADGTIVVSAESAAVSGAESAGAPKSAPCIHLDGVSNSATLTMEPGSQISGEDCVLVLESDDPALIRVDGATLDIAGFCVRGGGAPGRIAALSRRLGLPEMPQFCNAIEPPDQVPTVSDCTGSPPPIEEVVIEGFNFPSTPTPSGRVCGGLAISHDTYNAVPVNPLVARGDYYIEAFNGPIIMYLPHLEVRQTLVLNGDATPRLPETFDPMRLTYIANYMAAYHANLPTHSIVLDANGPSNLLAPNGGPYPGVAIYVSPTLQRESYIAIHQNVQISGAILAPGAVLTFEDGERESDAIRAGSLTLTSGAKIRVTPPETTMVAVSSAKPRLVR